MLRWKPICRCQPITKSEAILPEKAIRNKASHLQGNRTRLVDPDAGTITSRYNGFGELVSQSDARGNTYTYEYDRLGRFLSPDPYVQMPQNAQNFNRYSYALNNPMVYTDPGGYKIQGSPQYNGAAAFFYTQEVLGNGNMSNPFNTTSAYSYDYATNTYRNAAGRRVPFNEVKHNYVLPNASTVYYSAGVSHSNIKSSVVGYAKTFSSITDKALEMNFLMKNNIVYHVRAQNGRYIVVSFYPMLTMGTNQRDNNLAGVIGLEGKNYIYTKKTHKDQTNVRTNIPYGKNQLILTEDDYLNKIRELKIENEYLRNKTIHLRKRNKIMINTGKNIIDIGGIVIDAAAGIIINSYMMGGFYTTPVPFYYDPNGVLVGPPQEL